MKYPLLGMMFVGAALYGCSTTPQQASSAKSGDAAAQASAATTAGAANAASGQEAPKLEKVFYFPYDSDQLSAADRAMLNANAEFLARNPKVTVRIEGNADERGTREYNLALGDRRARAVLRMLAAKGVKTSNLKTVSYGKERPVATCHDESCWHLNRRVELVISGS